jgi:hypothetical protein
MIKIDPPGGARFPLGDLLATPGALSALAADGDEQVTWNLATIVNRHAVGDWGDLCPEDRTANDDALKHGGRLLSAYIVSGKKLWLITEADRSATTVLLPEEY